MGSRSPTPAIRPRLTATSARRTGLSPSATRAPRITRSACIVPPPSAPSQSAVAHRCIPRMEDSRQGCEPVPSVKRPRRCVLEVIGNAPPRGLPPDVIIPGALVHTSFIQRDPAPSPMLEATCSLIAGSSAAVYRRPNSPGYRSGCSSSPSSSPTPAGLRARGRGLSALMGRAGPVVQWATRDDQRPRWVPLRREVDHERVVVGTDRPSRLVRGLGSVGLWLGPVLRRCSQAREALELEARMGEMPARLPEPRQYWQQAS